MVTPETERGTAVHKSSLVLLVLVPAFLAFISCGTQKPADSALLPQFDRGNPSSALEVSSPRTTDRTGGHYLWGYYLFIHDPGENSLRSIPVRNVGTHWNVLKWLEQGPCTSCVSIVGITPNPSGTKSMDIKIKHPFPSPNLTGFDVRGIAMFNGSHVFPEAGLTTPDKSAGDGELVNADGYTTLYNSATAGSGPGGLQGYMKGKLATKSPPDATLNGYKRHITNAVSNTRSAFYAGDMVTASYEIKMPTGGFVFGYAVDASWAPPSVKPVTDPMNDFPPEANCFEPWRIETEVAPVGNGLVPQGGEVKLTLDVYDYQGKSSHATPIVECPELFDGAKDAAWISDGSDFSSWEVVLGNEKQAPIGDYKCLVRVVDNENAGSPPYLDLTAYRIVTLTVAPWSPGNLIWAKSAGGTGSDGANCITALADNSSVAVGSFSNSATFGQGEANQTVLNSAGGADIFIARYFPDGTLRWAKSAGGTNSDWANGIAALSNGSMVVTGPFGFATAGTAVFGQGEANETVLTSAGGPDIFIARYNPDGTLAWAKRAGGTNKEMGCAVAAPGDNSIVVIGYFEGSATFGESEPNETVLSSAGDLDVFIARYNLDGTLEWAKSAGGVNADVGVGIIALSDDSTVLTGYFSGSATFGQGDPGETVLDSAGSNDMFVARYNADGTLLWAKCAGGTDPDSGHGVSVLSDDSTVVTGSFASSATFGKSEPNQTVLSSAGDYDMFIARYNPDGTLAWAKGAGSTDYDNGMAITALWDNSIAVAGLLTGAATFGQGEPNETVLTSAGNEDIFVARYDSNGIFAWAKRAGGTASDWAEAIAAQSNFSVVVTGWFKGSATFGQGETDETELNSAGDYDIFIASFFQ